MNEPKFTPGSWRVYKGAMGMDKGLNPFFRGIVALLKHAGEEDDVAVILDRNESAHEFEANAHLIAAAPELYEALEELVLFNITEDEFRAGPDHLTYDCNECGCAAEDDHALIPHDPDCTVGKANAALKKARGNS